MGGDGEEVGEGDGWRETERRSVGRDREQVSTSY